VARTTLGTAVESKIAAVITIDDKYWPLVVFRFEGTVTMAQLEAYLKRQEEMTTRGSHSVALVLTKNLRMWETPVLRRQAEWLKQHRDEVARMSLGAALVIESPIVRGMLKALLWLQPMPQPHLVTNSVAQALGWLRARLVEANVRVELPEPAHLG